MNGEALGVIETIGMAAAIEAADSCVKSANVELIGYELTKGSGLVTIKIKGNVGAVKAAIEAAKVSASRVNTVFGTLIIPRPAKGIEEIIESDSTVGINRLKSVEPTSEYNSKDVTEDIDKNEEMPIDNVEGKDDHNTIQEDIDESIKEDSTEGADEGESYYVEENSKNLNLSDDGDTKNEEEVFDISNIENTTEQECQTDKDDVGQSDVTPDQENDDICNICHDPICPRRKGQPRNLCIHHKKA